MNPDAVDESGTNELLCSMAEIARGRSYLAWVEYREALAIYDRHHCEVSNKLVVLNGLGKVAVRIARALAIRQEAAERLLDEVIDRRAKLFGLNAPTAVAVGVGQITDREFAEQAAELIAGLRPDMARELRGAVPPVHDAGRTAVPEGYDTREPVSPASVAHSAETTTEPEPWADVDDPAPVPRREVVPAPIVEPDPEPAPVPAPRRPVYAPPTGGYMQRLGGNRPSTVVFNAP